MKVLTLGNFRHTVTVIRSLARAGHEIIVGRDSGRTFTQFSRYTKEVWDHPQPEHEPEFISSLVTFLRSRPDIGFVFPIGETFLECISRNMDLFPPQARIVMPNPSTLQACLDKNRMYGIIEDLGIPLPASARAGNPSELFAAAERVGFPCIVKPNRSFDFFFNQKAIICRTPEELKTHFWAWPGANDSVIVQKYIESYRPNCHFAAVNGNLLSYFEHNVVRTDRPDETGFEVDGVSVPPTFQLRNYCDRLIRRLNYSGVGCVQFLADSKTGEFYFLEINPRLDATCALPYYSGFDFPKMAVEIANPERRPASLPSSETYEPGQRGYWMLGDIQGFLHGIEEGTVGPRRAVQWIGNAIAGLWAADLHLTFAWNDPLPSAFLYLKLGKSVFQKARKRLFDPSQQRKRRRGKINGAAEDSSKAA